MDQAALAALLDKQAITETLYRYARGWDRRDLGLLEGCFHADAVVDQGGFQGRAHDLMATWMDGTAHVLCMTHLITNVLIELKGERAMSEAHFFAHHRRAATKDGGERDWFIKGRYLDIHEKRDGVWKIIDRTGVLDFEQLVDPTDVELQQVPIAGRGRYKPDDKLYAVLAKL